MASKKKVSKSKVKKFVAIAVAMGVIGGGGFAIKSLPYFVGETVTEVIDGDSFKIANKQTIRLASLDAPEDELCMGPEAKEALEKLILGKKVVLRDVKTDIYRRIMALVYVDGLLVNEFMVKNGLAVTTREAGDENKRVKAANEYARGNKLGIFSLECYQKEPPDPKCPIKGNIDDRTKTKEYLIPECRHYSKVVVEKAFGERWFCSEAEAKKAGWVRSNDCLGSEREKVTK